MTSRRSFLKSILAGIAAASVPAVASTKFETPRKFGETSSIFDGYVAGETEFSGYMDEVSVTKEAIGEGDFTIEAWVKETGECDWVHKATVRQGLEAKQYENGELVSTKFYDKEEVQKQWSMLRMNLDEPKKEFDRPIDSWTHFIVNKGNKL